MTQVSPSNLRAMCGGEALTPNAYESIPKIASVIQPGRRWDSPTKLTSPISLYSYSEKGMGSSRWKVAAAAFLAIVGSLLSVDADEHEHTVRRRLERGRLKRGSLESNGRLCVCVCV